MIVLASFLSLFLAFLGAVGIVSPTKLLGIIRHFESQGGIYAAAFLRVIMGMALLFSAPASRLPGIVRILGIIILVAGFITPLLGRERFRVLLQWWIARGPAFMRVWTAFALGFGLFLAYTVIG